MSDEKYLKYKNKYLDLKSAIELDGGAYFTNNLKILFYDNTNPQLQFLSTIKKGFNDFKKDNSNDFNKGYIVKADLKDKLNGIFNVYTYKLSDNKIVSNYYLDINKKDDAYEQQIHKILNYRIERYNKISTISLKNNQKLIIKNNINNLIFIQGKNMLDNINTNINNKIKIDSALQLLEMYQVYEDRLNNDQINKLKNRIGTYAYNVGSDQKVPKPPVGIKTLTIEQTSLHFDNDEGVTEKRKIIKNEIVLRAKSRNPYVTTKLTNIKFGDDLEFNQINDMILFKHLGKSNGQDILLIYDTFPDLGGENAQATQQTGTAQGAQSAQNNSEEGEGDQ